MLNDSGQWVNQSGGTTVVANPSGEPTAELEKLQVGNDIYSIAENAEIITNILTNENSFVCMGTANEIVQFGSGYGENRNLNFLATSSYDETTDRGQAVYTIAIPKSVKKIQYKMYVSSRRSTSAADLYKFCVGVKATLNTSTFSTPTDNDFIAKNLHGTPQTAIISGELTVVASSNYYLYIIGNGWHCFLYELKLIESESGGGASALGDLTDVNITSPTDGQVMTYDATAQKWKNATPSGGGGTLSITRTTLSTELMNASNHDYILSDAYTNYDFIEFWTSGAGYQNSEGELKLICASDLKDFMDTGRTFTMSGYASRYFNFKLTNATTLRPLAVASLVVYKVVGIKYTLS